MEVQIGANLSELTAGMTQAVAAVNGATSGISNSLGKLGGVVGSVMGVLAGGALFKDVVDETKKWTGEAVKLSRALGITTEEASVLNLALGDIYSDSDTYLAATNKLAMQVANEGDAFERMGIKTRNASGQLRPMGQIMQDSLEKLNGMKAGTDRTAAGIALFGRGWGEASKLMKLNNQVLEDARAKAEKLNLVVGADSVSAVKEYKAAMNDVEDVVTALKVRVGRELMPVLTDMADWAQEEGPKALEGLSVAINVVVTAFKTLKFIIEAVAIAIATNIMAMADLAVEAGQTIWKALKGDFSGAQATWRAATQAFKNQWGDAFEDIKTRYADLGVSLNQTWDPNLRTKRTGKAEGKGEGEQLAKKPGGKDESDKLLKTFKEQLEEKKALEENWFTWSTGRELSFWQEKLQGLEKGTKAYRAVLTEVNKLRKQDAQEDHEAHLEQLRAEMDADAANLSKKLALAQRMTAEERRLHKEGSKEVIAALRAEDAIRREMHQRELALANQVAQAKQAHALRLIAMEESSVQHRTALGILDAKGQLEQLQELNAQRMALTMETIDAELALESLAEERRLELLAQRQAAQDEAYANSLALHQQYQQQLASDMEQAFQPFVQAWEMGLENILNGTGSVTEMLGGMWKGLGKVLDRVLVDMITKFIAAETKKTLVAAWAQTKIVAAEAWGVTKKIALYIWDGLKFIAIQAWKAAAGAYSALASIPYVGPVLAPIAAAAVLAAVIGMGGKLASAAGGYDIPAGVNPITQLHEQEMVLPAKYANLIRGMADGEGGAGGNGGGNHFHVHAVDARGFERLLRDNQGPLVRVMSEAARNGVKA